MKRFITLAFLTLVTLALIGATLPDGEPRNVRLRAQVAGDSLHFRLQWNAPQRGRWDTPIEGYEWQLLGEPDMGAFNTVWADGTTTANNRRADPVIFFDCADSPTYFIGAVRAVGNFSDESSWGQSSVFTMTCNDSPPGPPTINLDTIPPDTVLFEPDSLVLMAVELGPSASWDPETGGFSFTALNDIAKMCAFAYRDGEPSLASRGPLVATMDSAFVATRSDVLGIGDAPPLGSACWYLTALEEGQAAVHLCTTDCPALQAFGFPLFPAWMRWPLLILGCLLWAHGIWQKRNRQGLRNGS